MLREFGMDAVLAAAASGAHGAWLVEIYADSDTAPLEPLEPAVRLLVAEAVRGNRRPLTRRPGRRMNRSVALRHGLAPDCQRDVIARRR